MEQARCAKIYWTADAHCPQFPTWRSPRNFLRVAILSTSLIIAAGTQACARRVDSFPVDITQCNYQKTESDRALLTFQVKNNTKMSVSKISVHLVFTSPTGLFEGSAWDLNGPIGPLSSANRTALVRLGDRIDQAIQAKQQVKLACEPAIVTFQGGTIWYNPKGPSL